MKNQWEDSYLTYVLFAVAFIALPMVSMAFSAS